MQIHKQTLKDNITKSLLWEKSEPSPFWENKKNPSPHFIKEGRSTYVNCVRIIIAEVTKIFFLMKKESGMPAFNLS